MRLAQLWFALASFGCICVCTAQQRISLDGTWQLRADGEETPVAVAVPAAFETALGPHFDGVAWYSRQFDVPADHRGRVRLSFAAVATMATVFCNGIEVGSHLGGWTPFCVDVTEALRSPGPNQLEVRVDEKVGHNTQGFLPIVQPHFGGIWQSVTLCLDTGPVLDRHALTLFGKYHPQAGAPTCELTFTAPALDAAGATAVLQVLDAAGELVPQARVQAELGAGQPFTGSLPLDGLLPWSPHAPHLYTVRISLQQGDTAVDVVERRIGFRDLRADGSRVLWNGAPLQLRGILHWGYSPPHLAPPIDREFWRRQLLDFRSLGFNCLKCCLWVPPRCVYELCDELGLLVWQEYPTWHPQMDQAHKDELLTEYGEFFVHDRSHASVAIRSITCETGQGADLDVVTALYRACKAAVPDTLVVDDSSWIGWQRITDFWDEHPYGNNSWLPGRIDEFAAFLREQGHKPLLLGECLAADTWVDRDRWLAAHGEQPVWWRPLCWDAQRTAERWLTEQFGAATLASLGPISREFGLANRRYQIERLRLQLPDTGYVVSVARDFTKARMGLYDDHDQLKWSAADWNWHRDTMLCLDLPPARRTIERDAAGQQYAAVRISHYGAAPLRGTLRLWTQTLQPHEVTVPVELQPGENSAQIRLPIDGDVNQLTRVRLHAELSGTVAQTTHWDLWQVPSDAPQPAEVLIVDALTTDLLDRIEKGARVLLRCGDRKGSLRTEAMWFLKGAPFAPEHPFHQRVSRDALLELCCFDFESGRVLPWQLLHNEVDAMLAFWDTHDVPEVRWHLLAADTRLGAGRLLFTSLSIDAGSGARAHLQQQFVQHLQHGPAAQHELSAATVEALRSSLDEQRIDLPTWRFRTDPQDQGRAGNWHDPACNVAAAPWRDLRAGSHWENQAADLEPYTGVAWYRVDVEVPASWRELHAQAVFEGVDDSFELWVNGQPAGTFGDAATRTSIWLERQVADLRGRLRAGESNTLVLRVVDHAGAGGLWKPVFLTTGPTDARSKLLH